MNNKKAVLIEFTDEADCLISYCEEHRLDINSIAIIALSPKAQAYLKSKNIPYSTTLEYFRNSDQETIIKKNEEIISYFANKLQGPVSLTEEFIFYIRLYIYHYLWIIEILNNLKEKGIMDSLIIVKSRSGVNRSLIINESERYVAAFCQKFCIEYKLDHCVIGNTAPLIYNEAGTSKILQKTCGYLGRLNLDKISKSSSPAIAVHSLSYNLDRLCSQIADKHPDTRCIVVGETAVSSKLLIALMLQLFNASPKNNVVYLPVNIFTDKAREPDAFSRAIHETLNANIFQHRGIFFKEELREKVIMALIPYLYKLNNQKEIIDSIFDKVKPRIALSQIGVGLGRVIGESSINHDIPSVFISHGSHKTPANEIEYIELFNLCKGFMLSQFGYAAISSPFAKIHFDYFKARYQRMPARPLITGPLIYSKLDAHRDQSIKKEGEKIILHATTLKTRGTDRFYFLETNDEFFSAVNDLIDVVSGMDNVKLLVRFHPGYQLSEKEIRSLLKPSEKLMISLTGPFQDVLAVSDILVSYSSTAIEEALLNFVPVVLYDKWNRYNHLDAPGFKDTQEVTCAYYATNRNDLKNCIEQLLLSRDVINKDSYYRYIYKEDYNPAFYDFISKLLPEHPEEKDGK